MGALKIDALPRSVGRQQDLHFRIVPEGFLRPQAILAAHATVDDDHGLLTPKQRADPALQVIQRVAVLGEDDELLMWRWRGLRRHGDASLITRRLFRQPIGDRRRREDLAEQAGQFAPLLVFTTTPY